MLRLLLVLVVATQMVTTTNITMPDGETRALETIGGRSYYFSPISVLVGNAITTCLDMGMQLVAFETEGEVLQTAYFILNTLGTELQDYHTSAIRIQDEWVWSSTGTVMNYNNWQLPDEPSETGLIDQACVYIFNSKFFDSRCDRSRYFICEQRC
ncbi:hypothetical protein B566_EDAN009601 [Ephemera danica]|nr:hypothetical protein B566_EDAN009601 [Ephemera danica]